MSIVKCTDRSYAIIWAVIRQGIPEGFESFDDYSEHCNRVMQESGQDERYVLNSKGEPIAYLSICISEDMHHKGDIFDITNVISAPYAKLGKEIATWIYKTAKLNGCSWVSRCKQEDDGSIRNIFKRI